MIYEYKENGITMKQFLDKIYLKYPDKKFIFTARLDPMAEGIVPLLTHDEAKNILNKYDSNKTYQVRIVLGFQTDSDDVLGLITKTSDVSNLKDYLCLKKELEKTNYTYQQNYHYFSSKRIVKRLRNKPDTPSSHQVTLFKSKILLTGSMLISEWINHFKININKIDKSKNFRQKEIINMWNKILTNKLSTDVVKFIDVELDVSSGFYVRQFVRDISDKLNIPLLAYKITRTKI